MRCLCYFCFSLFKQGREREENKEGKELVCVIDDSEFAECPEAGFLPASFGPASERHDYYYGLRLACFWYVGR